MKHKNSVIKYNGLSCFIIKKVCLCYQDNRNPRRLRLSGYGVELQMKSTEYKSQDDTQVHEDQNSEENSRQDEEESEVEGFEFTKLK